MCFLDGDATLYRSGQVRRAVESAVDAFIILAADFDLLAETATQRGVNAFVRLDRWETPPLGVGPTARLIPDRTVYCVQ